MATAATAPARTRFVLQPLSGTRIRDLALVLAGIALTAVCAQIAVPVPGSPVPITGQTFAVMLVGAGLGVRLGTTAMIGYVGLGALGLPIFSDASHGAQVLLGPTGGYLVGFLVAAPLMGWAAARGWDRTVLRAFPVFLLGQLVIFGIGLPWLAVVAHLGPAATLAAGFTPFVLGGIVKGILAGALLPAAWQLRGRP